MFKKISQDNATSSLTVKTQGFQAILKRAASQTKNNALSVLLTLCLLRARNQQMPLALCSFCLRAGSKKRECP